MYNFTNYKVKEIRKVPIVNKELRIGCGLELYKLKLLTNNNFMVKYNCKLSKNNNLEGAMKQVRMINILIIEAVFCVAFCLMEKSFTGVFTGVMAFPFEQIGLGLRMLSLSGGAGNAAAIILYILLCLIPCMMWGAIRKRKAAVGIDYILPGLSALLFAIIYYMINPGLFVLRVPGAGKWVLGSIFYSVLSGYLIIRVLVSCRKAEEEKLQKGIRRLCWFLNMVFVYLIFWQYLGTAIEAVKAIRLANSGVEDSGLYFTYLFLGLHYVINVLPYLFDVGIVFLAVRMLDVFKNDRYSDEAVRSTERLADFCAKALGVTVGADVGFNLLQFLFQGWIYQVDIMIRIPVISIIFVLVVFLFARYMREEQKLKQENDLFV